MNTPTESATLTPNAISFIGLSREYCIAIENAAETTSRNDFVKNMLKLLPRLYISATDLNINTIDIDEAYLENIMDEEYYDSLRRSVEKVMGEDDVYLEVFEEDMKYSDTPVSASISEGLCDICQVLYNFVGMLRGGDATDDVISTALLAVRDDFRSYWSSILCNVLRALNRLATDDVADESDDL